MTSDVQDVLREWGEAQSGPMNGDIGRALAAVIVDAIATKEGVSSICDLGCGNGYLASRLAARGYHVVGVDASDRLLAVAREHHSSDRIQYHSGFFGPTLAQTLPRAGQFDLVVSVDVVEHLYRPMSLIEAADALVKPGGHVVICTPYHGYLKNLAIALLGRWDAHHGVHWDGGHIKFFSVATLRALVSRRFDVQRFEYFGRFGGFRKNMICIARKRAS